MKIKETARVVSQEMISEGIYSLTLSVSFADQIRAGQFVSLFLNDRSRMLPRPISVCETNPEKKTMRLVYRVTGPEKGTAELAELTAGDGVDVLGPLGNGFPLDAAAGKRILLVGGGIGIPPMLMSCEQLLALPEDKRPEKVTFAVGYRTDDTYLLDDLKRRADVLVSTDDGSLGTHGTVIDAIREGQADADVMFACGPKPMLRAVKTYCEEKGMRCYVSMEARMLCGVGACLGCVVKTTGKDEHSNVNNARICKDGPVFDAKEVDLT